MAMMYTRRMSIDPVDVTQSSAGVSHQVNAMNTGRMSRAHSANRERDQWNDKSPKMADLTYSPYSSSPRVGKCRPYTASNITSIDVADIGSLVSRLSRPNISTARKSVLWSKPRSEYEFNYEVASNLKNPVLYWAQFPMLQKHYPGTWRVAQNDELTKIVKRLTKVTIASESRKDDCVTRRQFIEKIKKKSLLADIGLQVKVQEDKAPPSCQQFPPISSTPEERPPSASLLGNRKSRDSDEISESMPESPDTTNVNKD